MTELGKTEMVEYWVLRDWQVVQWRYLPTNPADVGEEWFTINKVTEAPDPDRHRRYASLYEALPAVSAYAYVDDGVEDEGDAHWLAMRYARQIGMHRWDGQEWVHTFPSVTW